MSGDGAKLKDPVCGMDVDPATAKHTTQHDGTAYYFCGAGCRKAFQDDPGHFLDPGYTAHM